MASIEDFLGHVGNFHTLKQGEQVRLLTFYQQRWGGQRGISATDIKALYGKARYPLPSNASAVLANEAKAKRMIHDSHGYHLTAQSEKELSATYTGIGTPRHPSIEVAQNLRQLVPKIRSSDGAAFLTEAVTCFEASCYRAAVVMSWALCYDHLLNHILNDPGHIANCNSYLSSRKMKVGSVRRREDFQELKESEVLDMCRVAGVTTKAVSKTLKQCLDVRNDYAHPSGQSITVSKAEAFIEDVVNNAIARLQ